MRGGRASPPFSSPWGWLRSPLGMPGTCLRRSMGVEDFARRVSPAEGTSALALVHFLVAFACISMDTHALATHVRTTTTTRRLTQAFLHCVASCRTSAVAMMGERDLNGVGSARRRRDRRLRSHLRHERVAIAMAVSEAQHHSAQRQKSERAGAWRPGVLEDPGPPHA